jgi:hypothetical protein
MRYQSILESLLYYSPKFKSILSKIDDPVAVDILEMEGENISQDITFINIDDDGVVTFAPMSKSIKKISDFLDNPNDMDKIFNPLDNEDLYRFDTQGLGPDVYKGNRNQIRLGKLVNKILGNKYNDNQVETFVNKLKSNLKSKQIFQIVSGSEIKKSFDVKTHAYLGKGSLGMSCMNTRDFFDLYTENTDSCRMLILAELTESGYKIVGRSIVWKLNSCVTEDGLELNIPYLIDRIYTSDDYLEYKFRDYAKEKGWAFKTYQGFGWRKEITFENRLYKALMTVKVKPGEYKTYPYMDTFTRLDILSGTLYNDNDPEKHGQGHVLSSTQGTYSFKFYPEKTLIKKFRDFFKI